MCHVTGNYGDEDEDDDDDDVMEPTALKKLKFASPHDMKSSMIEVQQIPAVNPGDPPFYTSVMKVAYSFAGVLGENLNPLTSPEFSF